MEASEPANPEKHLILGGACVTDGWRWRAETVMMMLKSKFGASVRLKTATAQVNEVLAKCVLHNLTCIVHAIFTAGLAPRFWQEAAPASPRLSLVP